MTPGASVSARFRRERRVRRRLAAARALAWSLAAGGPAAVLLVLHSRLTDPAPGAAWSRLALAWSALAATALGGALLAFLWRRPGDVALALALDRRHRTAGLLPAAAFVLDGGAAESGLAGLVLARADEAVARIPVESHSRAAALRLRRAAAFFVLSLLIALLPGGPTGAVFGLGGGSGGPPVEGGPGAGAAARGEEGAETRRDARIPLDEIVRLELKSDRRIYGLNAEVTLIVRLEALKPVVSDVPLELMLAITDGLPSPDVGLGVGFRPVPLALDWSVPKEPGTILRQTFPMKEKMTTLGIYRPGLFTCEVLARPRDDGGSISEGVRSNEVTFQVAENKEDLQSRAPQPQGQGTQQEKKTDDPSEDEGRQGGGSKPKLGDRDRLAEAERVAALVEPIVNPGPTVEKDVSVFEREPGGPAPPLPVRPKPTDDDAGRTFLRRPEVPALRPNLSPEERDVLRRYFDSIRARKKP
jgi:hypothetical protein